MRITTVVIFICMPVVGCSKSGSNVPATEEPAKPTTARDERFPARGEEAVVVLDRPGAPPRAKLRWSPKPGQTGAVKLGVKWNDGSAASGKLSAEIVIAVTYNRPNDGDAVAQSDVQADIACVQATATVPAQMQSFGKELEQGLCSLKGRIVFGVHGTIRKTEFESSGSASVSRGMGADLFGAVKARIREAIVPWPDEAIGSGARWRVLERLPFRGTSIKQTTEVSLDELTEPGGTLTVVVAKRTLDANSLNGWHKRARFEVTSELKTEGTATLHFDLRKPMEIRGRRSVTTSFEGRMKMNGVTGNRMGVRVYAEAISTPVEAAATAGTPPTPDER